MRGKQFFSKARVHHEEERNEDDRWWIVPCARGIDGSRIVGRDENRVFLSVREISLARENLENFRPRDRRVRAKRCPRTKGDPDANEDTGRTTPSRLTLTDSVHDWWNVRPQRACTRETPFLSGSRSPHHARCSREKGQWLSTERASSRCNHSHVCTGWLENDATRIFLLFRNSNECIHMWTHRFFFRSLIENKFSRIRHNTGYK